MKTVIGATVIAVHEPSGTQYGAGHQREAGTLYDAGCMRTGGPLQFPVSLRGLSSAAFTGIMLELGTTQNQRTVG